MALVRGCPLLVQLKHFFYWLDYGEGLLFTLQRCSRERFERERYLPYWKQRILLRLKERTELIPLGGDWRSISEDNKKVSIDLKNWKLVKGMERRRKYWN